MENSSKSSPMGENAPKIDSFSSNPYAIANPASTPYSEQHAVTAATTVKPYFDIINGCWHYIGVKMDSEKGAIHTAPLRLCNAFEIFGQGKDSYGDYHSLLRWIDSITGEEQTLALPTSLIGEREGWQLLNSKGLAVNPKKNARDILAEYLLNLKNLPRYAITHLSGWQYDAFVVPNGEVIGKPTLNIFFPAANSHHAAFTPSGTSADWRKEVGQLARHNPLAMTCVACSLAGASLGLLNERDGIGLHLHAETSSGKSTCGDVGASVWGNPLLLLQSWDGTSIGLTNSAEFANGMMLYLDEIGAGDAKKMGGIIYTMLNGISRTQGHKDGGNRAKRSWLMTLISTGEIPMSQFLTDGGHAIRGGQEIRMLDIPAEMGKFRAFDCIHNAENGDTFARALTAAARKNYGSLGREFVAWLIEHKSEVKPWVEAVQSRMLSELPEQAAPTVRRATRKFAIIAAVLEMASAAGLTGWTTEESYHAVCTIWQRWLTAFGLASRDEARLIEQAQAVLSQYQYSRFAILPLQDKDPNIQNLMGYKRIGKVGSPDTFLVLPEAFKNEVIKGYEPKKACAILHRAGMLARPNGRNGWTVNIGRSQEAQLGDGYKMNLRPIDSSLASEDDTE